jgi:hypothetical protein
MLGPGVREPKVRAAAQAVCDEVGLRARTNIQLLVRRLRSEGFAFHTNDDARTPVEPFRPASTRCSTVIILARKGTGARPTGPLLPG